MVALMILPEKMDCRPTKQFYEHGFHDRRISKLRQPFGHFEKVPKKLISNSDDDYSIVNKIVHPAFCARFDLSKCFHNHKLSFKLKF